MDLILKGGRVIDPSQGIDRVTDVAFADGKVAAIGKDLKPATRTTDVRDVSGHIVRPASSTCTPMSIGAARRSASMPRSSAARAGVTTSVDTGSAGPGNFAGLPQARHRAVRGAHPRLSACLASPASSASRTTIMVGESEDIRLMAPLEAVAVADANRDVIVGIKVRVGRHASGDQGAAPLDIALQVAEEAGMPVMAHIDIRRRPTRRCSACCGRATC